MVVVSLFSSPPLVVFFIRLISSRSIIVQLSFNYRWRLLLGILSLFNKRESRFRSSTTLVSLPRIFTCRKSLPLFPPPIVSWNFFPGVLAPSFFFSLLLPFSLLFVFRIPLLCCSFLSVSFPRSVATLLFLFFLSLQSLLQGTLSLPLQLLLSMFLQCHSLSSCNFFPRLGSCPFLYRLEPSLGIIACLAL